MIDATMTAEDLEPPAYVREDRTFRVRARSGSITDVSWLGAMGEAIARSVDTTALPGLVVNFETVEHERARRALIKLVDRFAAEGFSWSGDQTYRPSEATREAAQAFVAALPSGTSMPRVAPDSEGSIAAVWERPGAALVIVIEGWRLHMVTGPGTANAEYFDGLEFARGEIPARIHQELAAFA